MRLSFVHPALAWGLLAALVPVAVHLFFRRRPRPTPFPAIDFILRARRETERRLRLKRVLLFTARTLLLAAAAAALARPRLQRPQRAAAAARGPAAVAIVLDASASMTYRLHGHTLFERARADALAALDGLGADEPASAVICGGLQAPSAVGPTFDRPTVRRALSEAEPTLARSDMSACVAAAARSLSESATGALLGKRIVVATDLTASAWRLDVAAPMVQTPQGAVRPEVTILDAARGEALPNVALTDLTAEPDPAVGPRSFRVTATVVSSGSPGSSSKGEGAPDVELQLRAGPPQAPVAIRAFAQLPAGGTAKKALALTFPAGGPAVLSVTLPHDALEMDDARVLTVSVPRQVRALIVNGVPSVVKYRDAAFFVEAALSSPASPVKPTVVDAESLEKVRLADFDVVFLLDVRSLGPKARELTEFVERGGGLFLAMGDEVDPELYDSELAALLPRPLHLVKTAAERGAAGVPQPARFTDIDWSHPALQVFTGDAREGLEGVRTWKYMLLKPAEKRAPGERVIASYDDGAPALVEAQRGQGRVVLYTSTLDREWSDWTIRTSFLPAVQRLAAWLAGGLDARRGAPSPVGAPRPITVRDGQRLLAVVGPDGRERAAADLPRAEEGGAPTVVPDRPGLWSVKVEERGQVHLDPRLAFAVHPDPRESDTTRLDPVELTAYFGGATHARLASADRVGDREISLWSVLLALGLAAFLAEGLLLA